MPIYEVDIRPAPIFTYWVKAESEEEAMDIAAGYFDTHDSMVLCEADDIEAKVVDLDPSMNYDIIDGKDEEEDD